MTDGAPAGCDERIAYITMLAESALATSGVATYAVGLTDSQGQGLNQRDMDALAEAGGTSQAFFVSDGPTAAGELLTALEAIRGNAVPCDFPLPEATSEGQAIDPSVVTVTYTAGEGDSIQLTKADAVDCEDSLSWHYDDEKAPTRIVLCPAACAIATANPAARFDILVGCAPILKEPR